MEQQPDPGGLHASSAASSISNFLECVVEHNTIRTGAQWPSDEQIQIARSGTMSAHQLPLPSPGGTNVQPSPKDSGIDVNSPCHNLEQEQVALQSEGELDNKCDRHQSIKDMQYGPSSVESGAVLDCDAQDSDQEGLFSESETTPSSDDNLATLKTSLNNNELVLCSVVQKSKSCEPSHLCSNISYSSADLNSTPNCSSSSITGTEQTQSGCDNDCQSNILVPETTSEPNNSLSTVLKDSLTSDSPNCCEEPEEDENDLHFDETITSINDVPATNEEKKTEHGLTKVTEYLSVQHEKTEETVVLQNKHHGEELVSSMEASEEEHNCAPEQSDMAVSDSPDSPKQQGPNPLVGIQPGFHNEFARFLQESEGSHVSEDMEHPKKAEASPRTPVKRKHRYSVSGAVDEGSMLPVIKIRKVSPGQYTAHPQPSSPPEVFSPKLKIKYGSPDDEGKRAEVQVLFNRSMSLPVSCSLQRNEADSDDDFLVKKSHSTTCVSSVKKYQSTSRIPVIDPYELDSEEDDLSFAEPPWVSRVNRCKTYRPLSPPKVKPLQSHGDFCIKSFMAANETLVNLRRRVMRLFRVLFPDISYPRWFHKDGPQVDCLIGQVICALNLATPESDTLMVLPGKDFCCLEANISVCKSPQKCLKSLRTKICHLIESLLPDLQFGSTFDRQSPVVDDLLQKVYLKNRQAVSKSCEKT